MILNLFDPKLPHKYLRYGRFSHKSQNARSIAQQFEEIDRTIARNHYSWIHVDDRSDAGITGKRVRSRPGFNRMLQHIATGVLAISLILVDTFERFGRAEELDHIRRKLWRKHGVLILTSDTNFLDPTTSIGRTIANHENVRAVEDNRVKSHNVLRGKRDAVGLKRWSGGPPPFGFKLQTVFREERGRQEKSHSILVPDSETSWIIRLLFEKAFETGWGSSRLTRFLNEHPNIPEELKPFNDQTVGHWLDETVFYGTYQWNDVCTDLIDDRRVIQPNKPSEIIVVEDYCEPIVSKDICLAVQAVRKARSEKLLAARAATKEQTSSFIKPVAAGMSIHYPLSGLVHCLECGRVMVCGSPSPYTTVSGESRSYAAYRCPFSNAGGCTNRRSVPEAWLRQQVLIAVERRLLSPPSDDQSTNKATGSARRWSLELLQKTTWFPELVLGVQQEIDRQQEADLACTPDLRNERSELEEKIRGWAQSLGNPNLSSTVRNLIEAELAQATRRVQEIDAFLATQAGLEKYAMKLLDPEAIVDRLNRLADVLATNNPTRSNLELSLHIDRIEAHPDGRIVMRICRLGAFYDIIDLLALDLAVPGSTSDNPSSQTATRRRRARLRVIDDFDSDDDLEAANYFATDPQRFAGLPDAWFWFDEFQIPVKVSWTTANAVEIAQYRLDNRTTIKETAEQLGICTTTVKTALKLAKDQGVDASDAVLKLPRKPCWADEHAEEVEQYMREFHPWATQQTASEHFHRSLPTIGKALKIARDRRTGPAGPDNTVAPLEAD